MVEGEDRGGLGSDVVLALITGLSKHHLESSNPIAFDPHFLPASFSGSAKVKIIIFIGYLFIYLLLLQLPLYFYSDREFYASVGWTLPLLPFS